METKYIKIRVYWMNDEDGSEILDEEGMQEEFEARIEDLKAEMGDHDR